jgi:hypothetical protein
MNSPSSKSLDASQLNSKVCGSFATFVAEIEQWMYQTIWQRDWSDVSRGATEIFDSESRKES